MIQIILFIVLSTGLLYVSRASLQHPGSHGFCRFLAWEAILALVLLNWEFWFVDPFSSLHLVSWLLLCLSIVPVVWGVRLLRGRGRPDERREDETLLGLEKTTELVTTGLYAYIRHPLYSSLLLLAWGAYLKAPSWLGSALVAAATLSLWLTAIVEERENIRYFGPAYAAYMRRTRRFIPLLF